MRPVPRRRTQPAENQLALLPDSAAPAATWPDVRRFPHNESDGTSVGATLRADLTDAADVLVVTGYASLAEVVRLLAQVEPGRPKPLRILFGAEPFLPTSSRPVLRKELAEEMAEHWRERGFSVELSGAVLHACSLARLGDVQVRLGVSRRPVHAKIYVSERAATVGSSNFTPSGLRHNAEANVRFAAGAADRDRYTETRALAEGLWQGARDFTDGFVALLEQLSHATTWQETLARGCALLLEGEWARTYVWPDAAELEAQPLWPHQLQGISQALWVLEHRGGVLVADATGSGKTRMGAWLLRATYDQRIATGHRPFAPLLIAPPAVLGNWQRELQDTGLAWQVRSHGSLSNETAAQRSGLERAIVAAEILAIDEAHNFLNNTKRTRRLVAHQAEQALLFTATPINRKAADVLALVELLGADNFTDEALERLRALRRASALRDEDLELLRAEIQRFTVRRTRRALNRIAEENEGAYRTPEGVPVRYPRHRASYFACDGSGEDRYIAARIAALADRLHGVLRVGAEIKLPLTFKLQGISEERYVALVASSAAALSRFHVMKCLRSSRAALVEHLHGTAAAWRTFAAGTPVPSKQTTGDVIGRLEAAGGKLPAWKLGDGARAAALVWLVDAEAHAAACAADAATYREIADLALQMSPAREEAKLEHLRALHERLGSVIAFDGHVITLELFARSLGALPVRCFTGQGGAATKRRAVDALGLESSGEALVALCSDALSEGINLQGARCVVHLDTPTVVRVAEQRAGRVDRMNSPHAEVEIWWPKDPPELAPQRRDVFRERHDLVTELIGANIELPTAEDARVEIEELAAAADIERAEGEVRFADAFQPVRDLIGEAGLVPARTYRQMRSSQVELRTCVSWVAGDRPWAFLAVGTARKETVRWAPRWVFFDGPDAPPLLDLGAIASLLRDRLGPETPPASNPADETLVERFLGALQRSERTLLPLRRQRALEQLERMLVHWSGEGWAHDAALPPVVRAIQLGLRGNAEDRLDPRLAADAWLELLRPRIRRALENRGARSRLFRLADLDEELRREPLPARQLRAAFEALPRLPGIERRVEAMIVGVPASNR